MSSLAAEHNSKIETLSTLEILVQTRIQDNNGQLKPLTVDKALFFIVAIYNLLKSEKDSHMAYVFFFD